MAWTAPKTWVGNEVPTAANLNIHLRDNMLETMPAKATQDGQIFVGNGVNSITPRFIQADRISTFESTSSTSYTNLATVGPSVTVTHGSMCIVLWSCQLQNNTANAASHMSWSMTGSSNRAAFDLISITQDAVSASQPWRLGNVDFLTGLFPGTTTFKAEYKVAAGTADFSDRFLAVIPL
jgi:hypothetical protein